MKKKNGKNWIRNVLWLGFYVAVGYTLFAAIRFKAQQEVEQVKIHIVSEDNQRSLIGESDVLRYINRVIDKDVEIQKIEDLDVKKIEAALNKSKYIEHAEVYVDNNGILHVSCKVRTPIVRFDRGEKDGFYLDKEGNIIPLSKRSTVRVPVANGYLGEFTPDYFAEESNTYRQVFELAKKVKNDPFLEALIEQIYVESNGKVILVPKLGRQKILFGEIAGVENKFEKLKAFYKTGMPNSGWNRFKYLNLEWKDQVIGKY